MISLPWQMGDNLSANFYTGCYPRHIILSSGGEITPGEPHQQLFKTSNLLKFVKSGNLAVDLPLNSCYIASLCKAVISRIEIIANLFI